MSDHYLVREGHCLAVFNSTHRALKAEGILKGMGLPILLIPAPRALATDCGLALRFEDEHLSAILQILRSRDLQPAYVSCLRDGQYNRYQEHFDDNH